MYTFTVRLHCSPARCAVYAFIVRQHAGCCVATTVRQVHLQFIDSSSAVHLPFIYCSSTTVIYYCGAPLPSSATLRRCSYCVRRRSFLVFLLSYLFCSVSSACSVHPRTDCIQFHAVLQSMHLAVHCKAVVILPETVSCF